MNNTAHDGSPPAVLPSVGTWVAQRLGAPSSAPLPAADIAALTSALVPSAFRPGQHAYDAGHQPDGVWIVVRGMIEVAVNVGGQHLVADILRSGDVFGDITLFGEHGQFFSAKALEATTCLLLPARSLTRLVTLNPAITRHWLEGLATRFADSQIHLLATLAGPLTPRAARLLLGETRDGVVRLTQTSLAAMLGAPRPSVNRVLQQFENARLIDRQYRQILVLDPAGLRSIAGEQAIAPGGAKGTIPKREQDMH
ncbi:MAG TPA: Crp/Fnr family transcriptional regulator [Pseudonocardiaceae bacterium]|nr:Crp/Fnr family transcriptional regulator [Pseudonocardiaceae bacterium]